jgi:hypothetical protein
MKIETVHEEVRYLLSNENHKQGELVYPIGWGRQTENDGWVLHKINWKETFSDFPDSPHTVKSIEKHKKEVTVHTNFGYSFHDSYYKIIKVERQVKVSESIFGGTWEWQEFDIKELNIKAGNPNDLPF